MKILIIGAGLSGVTTAYFLQRRGHEVSVIDREPGAGLETSYANGGLLTASMAEPWNTPGCWRVLLGSIGRSEAAMQLRLSALPSLMGWGITFLRNSQASKFERNALSNLRLALHSLRLMESVRQDTGIEYGRTARGALKIFRDADALDRAAVAAERLLSEGLGFQKLSREQTIALEPALAPIAERLAGAIHYQTDETGDAHRFCVALAEHARQLGVEFKFNTPVTSIEANARQVTGVNTNAGRLTADRYIVAAASYSAPLLHSAGIRLPVRPAKGYSVTFDVKPGMPSLGIPLIDDDLHAAIVPFDGAIRAAGTAEFAGFDAAPNPDRIRNLIGLLKQVLPQMSFDAAAAKPWNGLRAMSADGVPLIGATSIPHLFVSTGHGHLGWTMAAGSAQLLTDLICGDAPSIDARPYSPTRSM